MAKEDTENHQNDRGIKPEKKLVIITVDGRSQKIERGTYSLPGFKEIVGIAENMDVDQVINGTFEQLDESTKIHIKGEEIFVSHVKTGQSS